MTGRCGRRRYRLFLCTGRYPTRRGTPTQLCYGVACGQPRQQGAEC